MYSYQASCISNIGLLRSKNEDNFLFGHNININKEKRASFYQDEVCNGFLVCVFDGVGGGKDGEVASFIGAQRAQQIIDDMAMVDDRVLINLYKNINEEIINYSNTKNIDFCGTTAISLLLNENTAKIVNVGDSKCFLIRKGQLLQLSKDHTDEEMLKSCGISNIKPSLTQFLGKSEEKLEIEPYINDIQTQSDDIFILCSDGLTSEVSNDDICNIVNATENVEEINKNLEEKIINKGARDNFTIITIRIN